MSGTITTEKEVTRTLGPEASARVIARAWQVGARVCLRNSQTGVDAICAGGEVDDAGTQLTVEVCAGKEELECLCAGAGAHVELFLADRRYTFETRCLWRVPETDEDLLVMERPRVITVIERRRSRRREFQEPAEVTLEAADGLDPRRSRGMLLNLSMDGMACKVREEDTESMAEGCMLRVMFRPGGSLREFDVNARVINVTRGASANHAIVGMEFTEVESPSFPREVLQTTLEGTG